MKVDLELLLDGCTHLRCLVPRQGAQKKVLTPFLLWIFLVVTPASADEFTVGILVGPAESETIGSTFVEGFQLAVDQSPDVSHPPGVEGGDHLGSIDVVMVVVDSATEVTEFVTAAVDMIESEGAAIIVADVASDVLVALFGPVTESETMLIAMSDTGGAEFPETLFFFAAARRDGAMSFLTDRTPAFEDAFVASYGRSPSAVATRGYLAGRLVDVSVEATNRDPFDEQALTDALILFGGRRLTPEEILGTITDPQERLDYIHNTLNTWLGDANFDGEFNSSDLVSVLNTGQFEDDIELNSRWSTGDWNSDGEFTSADLVVALADSGFGQGPRAAVSAVPEPSGVLLLLLMVGLAMTACRARE